MLMFVGEDLSVVTVASRRPEPPDEAPAIVSVVDASTIERQGFRTLADLLSTQPGFYLNPGDRGTTPFLRGIPEGVLFLYDGVPLSADVTKTLHPLDRELSLRNTKRVEIVRGPASVLWGPDAFAGIVNVVPRTGRDSPGLETGLFGDTDRYYGAYLNWGLSGKEWDVFLSGYGARDRYHLDTFTLQRSVAGGTEGGSEPFGEDDIDDSEYLEVTGNATVGEWLRLSGRFSTFIRRFTLQDTGELRWAGERESPVSYLKATLSKAFGRTLVALTGYYENITYDVTDVDLKREQENDIYYGEVLLDRFVGDAGRLTAGLSYRSNKVNGAVVEDGFLPDFLKPGNTIFVPEVTQKDFHNDLASAFAQYRYEWRGVDCWLGGRWDDHSQYESKVSYSLGLNWPVRKHWRIKAALGTAYRSPYSGQLFGGTSFDPEKVSTVNLQVAWKPSPGNVLELTGFYSNLTDHISEDPFGGLSAPSDQEILGLEFMARRRLSDRLDLYANVTAMESWGEDEQYRVLRYSFVRPDGTRVDVFDSWEQPFKTGPEVLANLGLRWRFHPKASLVLHGGITSRVPFSFEKDTVSGSYSQDPLLRATLTIRDVPVAGSMLTIRGMNILDRDYQVPGTYGPAEGEPLALYAEWAWRF
jgi:outer membrane receptor protein involved in Fe transport